MFAHIWWLTQHLAKWCEKFRFNCSKLGFAASCQRSLHWHPSMLWPHWNEWQDAFFPVWCCCLSEHGLTVRHSARMIMDEFNIVKSCVHSVKVEWQALWHCIIIQTELDRLSLILETAVGIMYYRVLNQHGHDIIKLHGITESDETTPPLPRNTVRSTRKRAGGPWIEVVLSADAKNWRQ